MTRDIRDLSFDELRAALVSWNEPPFRAAQIFAWLCRRRISSFDEFSDLPHSLRERLSREFSLRPLEAVDIRTSADGTSKTLFRLADGNLIETVSIPSGERRTICLSTQAGCKFACAFCASGRGGFHRNLTPSEILGQVLALRDSLDVGLTNIVFMGMGEPLDNFDNLERAIRILNDARGFGFAARRMTVSTSGLVPGIERFGGLELQVNLSVSIHAADDETRSRLMPVNRRYPLAALTEACERYLAAGGRKITFEYVLLKGVNDRAADAGRLIQLARRLRAKVNLIAFSPVSGLPFERPDRAAVGEFARRLKGRGVQVTVRNSKGSDIQAACGQLSGTRPIVAERV
jgi:23S rRNA (adenine2503-C2)-methyltransferase